MKDWNYKSLRLDQEIDIMVMEIISQYGVAVDTREITSSLVAKLDNYMIKKLEKLISMTIDEMAIIAKVKYSPTNEKFTLDFRVEDEELTHGEIVELGLHEILFHKITYRKNIKDSVINSLLYTLVQKDPEVA